MSEVKKLSLAIFETPVSCETCPCSYYTEGAFLNYCQLKVNISPDISVKDTAIPYDDEPIPDWCPLKPVVFDERYAK